jgi:hypothetical protein
MGFYCDGSATKHALETCNAGYAPSVIDSSTQGYSTIIDVSDDTGRTSAHNGCKACNADDVADLHNDDNASLTPCVAKQNCAIGRGKLTDVTGLGTSVDCTECTGTTYSNSNSLSTCHETSNNEFIDRLTSSTVQCADGYHGTPQYTNGAYSGGCTENVCTCANGIGATNTACPTNGDAKCASCDAGRYLDSSNACLIFDTCTTAEYQTTAPVRTTQNRLCDTRVCTCASGTGVAATGAACTEGHGNAQCTSCSAAPPAATSTAPTLAPPSPRTCTLGSKYETTAPVQTTQNRVCTDVVPCDADTQHETVAATLLAANTCVTVQCTCTDGTGAGGVY